MGSLRRQIRLEIFFESGERSGPVSKILEDTAARFSFGVEPRNRVAFRIAWLSLPGPFVCLVAIKVIEEEQAGRGKILQLTAGIIPGSCPSQRAAIARKSVFVLFKPAFARALCSPIAGAKVDREWDHAGLLKNFYFTGDSLLGLLGFFGQF